jgi:hypothetical protein
MLSRRDLIASGAAFTHLRADDAAAQQRRSTDADTRAIEEISDAVRELKRPVQLPSIAQIRERQRIFLRQNQRYPQFVDVGVGVWERVQDWHVANQMEMKVARSQEGRYLMEFMLSQLVLRPEIPDLEVGMAYDR